MNARKKAAAAAVTAVAVTGVAVNAVVENPVTLLPDAAVAVLQPADDGASSAPEKQRTGFAAKVGNWLLALPAAVRLLVMLPLWCIGWVLLTALTVFTAGVMTPLAARVLGWLCLALVLATVFAVSVKAAFPRTKLRKLLRPANLLLPAIGALVLCAADLALPTMWKNYGAAAQWVWRIGGTGVLALMCALELRHQGKCSEKEPTAVPAASLRTPVEQEAMRLADTVCPKP